MRTSPRSIWFDMDHPAQLVGQDWMPNAAELVLSEDLIERIERTIALASVSSAIRGGGDDYEFELPTDVTFRFFVVTESGWRGALQLGRRPWQGSLDGEGDPVGARVCVSPKGVSLNARFPERDVRLSTARLGIDQFREWVRQIRSKALAANIDAAMPAGDNEEPVRKSAGPGPL